MTRQNKTSSIRLRSPISHATQTSVIKPEYNEKVIYHVELLTAGITMSYIRKITDHDPLEKKNEIADPNSDLLKSHDYNFNNKLLNCTIAVPSGNIIYSN